MYYLFVSSAIPFEVFLDLILLFVMSESSVVNIMLLVLPFDLSLPTWGHICMLYPLIQTQIYLSCGGRKELDFKKR